MGEKNLSHQIQHEIDADLTNIKELKEVRTKAFNNGDMSLYSAITRNIKELNNHIKALQVYFE